MDIVLCFGSAWSMSLENLDQDVKNRFAGAVARSFNLTSHGLAVTGMTRLQFRFKPTQGFVKSE